MVREVFRNLSIGKKLLLIEGSIILGLMITCTVLVTTFTHSSLKKKYLEDLKSEEKLVVDMIEVYDGTLSRDAEKLGSIFASRFSGEWQLVPSRTIDIKGIQTPALKCGTEVINNNFELVDRFKAQTGAVATVFARMGDDFVRVNTSLTKEDGSRAVGTFLGKQHPGYVNLIGGRPFTGIAVLFGRTYKTHYIPIKDQSGETIGIYFVGVDITEELEALKQKIRSIKFGETGYVYALDASDGPARGTLVVHPSIEGQNIIESKSNDGIYYIKEILDKKEGLIEYYWDDPKISKNRGLKYVAFSTYEPWKWTIGSCVYMKDFSKDTAVVMFYLIGSTTVVLILLGALIYFTTTHFVARPLKTASEFARSVAEGDLTRDIEVKSKDEIGVLMGALNLMVGRLRDVIKIVKKSTDSVHRASGSLNKNSQELYEGAQVQSESAEETSASMEQISASLKEVARHTEQLDMNVEETSHAIDEIVRSISLVADNSGALSESVQETSATISQMMSSIEQVAKSGEILSETVGESSSTIQEMAASISEVTRNVVEAGKMSEKSSLEAKTGGEAVSRTIDGINRISSRMHILLGSIEKLGVRSLEIDRIIKIIDDIADQSNLLALNASIVAAKAGPEGRAFAVVAEEVRELAKRSAGSTKDIAKLIKLVQAETKEAIDTAKLAADDTSEGIQLADKAGTALQSILESVERTNSFMSQIASAAQEQNRANARMVSSVERMVQATDDVTRAMKEQAQGSMQIRKAVEDINDFSLQVAKATKDQSAGGVQIRSSVEAMREMTHKVSLSTAEQKKAGENIVKAVDGVTRIARNNLTAAKQLSMDAEDMSEEARAQAEVIGHFRI